MLNKSDSFPDSFCFLVLISSASHLTLDVMSHASLTLRSFVYFSHWSHYPVELQASDSYFPRSSIFAFCELRHSAILSDLLTQHTSRLLSGPGNFRSTITPLIIPRLAGQVAALMPVPNPSTGFYSHVKNSNCLCIHSRDYWSFQVLYDSAKHLSSLCCFDATKLTHTITEADFITTNAPTDGTHDRTGSKVGEKWRTGMFDGTSLIFD